MLSSKSRLSFFPEVGFEVFREIAGANRELQLHGCKNSKSTPEAGDPGLGKIETLYFSISVVCQFLTF